MNEKFKQWLKDNEGILDRLSKSLTESGIKSEYVRVCLGMNGYVRVELDYDTGIEAVRMPDGPFKARFTEVIG